MKTQRKFQVSASEQEVLDGVQVRLIAQREQKRFDWLIETQHYLKDATLVGERLCYVAEYDGEWLALLAWSAAAYHLRDRDEWIGWTAHFPPQPSTSELAQRAELNKGRTEARSVARFAVSPEQVGFPFAQQVCIKPSADRQKILWNSLMFTAFLM